MFTLLLCISKYIKSAVEAHASAFNENVDPNLVKQFQSPVSRTINLAVGDFVSLFKFGGTLLKVHCFRQSDQSGNVFLLCKLAESNIIDTSLYQHQSAETFSSNEATTFIEIQELTNFWVNEQKEKDIEEEEAKKTVQTLKNSYNEKRIKRIKPSSMNLSHTTATTSVGDRGSNSQLISEMLSQNKEMISIGKEMTIQQDRFLKHIEQLTNERIANNLSIKEYLINQNQTLQNQNQTFMNFLISKFSDKTT